MGPQAVHRKQPGTRVRTGCTTCKRRKIKCGEEKPVCKRCENGNWECRYDLVKPWIFEPSPSHAATKCKDETSSSNPLHRPSKGGDKRGVPTASKKPLRPLLCAQQSHKSDPDSEPPSESIPTQQPLQIVFQQNFYSWLPLKPSKHTGFGIDYYVNAYAPSHELLVTLQDGTNGLLSKLLPWALEDGIILSALIAESLAFAAGGNLDSDLGRSALVHRTTAVQKIMQQLRTQCTLSVIQAVICLVFVDMRLGNREHVPLHLQGLRAMVSSFGGLDHLGCDGMQKDILIVFNDIYKFLDASAFASNNTPFDPEAATTLKFGVFTPEIAAKKKGITMAPLSINEQMLFPFLPKIRPATSSSPNEHV